MGVPFNELTAGFSEERQAKIKTRTEELVRREMTLRELRKAMSKTQVQIAKAMGKQQAAVARMEQQSDMLISTLDHIVSAMGGHVRIVVEMPGHSPVVLTGLGEIGASMPNG
jgi:hypothetical protein